MLSIRLLMNFHLNESYMHKAELQQYCTDREALGGFAIVTMSITAVLCFVSKAIVLKK